MDIESQILNPLSEKRVNNNNTSIDKQYIDILFSHLVKKINLSHNVTKEWIKILAYVVILEGIILGMMLNQIYLKLKLIK